MNILIVEDDPMSRALLKRLLEKSNHSVLESASVRQALVLLADTSVDLVISDIDMPDQSGIDLVKALKEDVIMRRIPVLICSSVAARDTILEAAKNGIAGYLLKPFIARDLWQKVNAIAARTRPFLAPRDAVMRQLGVGLDEYSELLALLVSNSLEAVEALRQATVSNDARLAELIVRRMESGAATLGAHSLKAAIATAGALINAAPGLDPDRYLKDIRSEVHRLEQAHRVIAFHNQRPLEERL